MAVVVRGTAYGFFVTRDSDSKLMFSGAFLAPLVFSNVQPSNDIQVTVGCMCGLGGYGPFAEQGLLDDLDDLIDLGDTLTCHLYTNNFVPDCDSVIGDFTEAAWAGYAAQALSGWTPAVIVSPHLANKTSGVTTFTST